MALLFSQPIAAEDYTLEKGECPLDRGRADYLKFKDQDLDLGLLARTYPLGIRVCPRCLLACSESDFLTGVRLPGSDTITGTLNSKLNSLAGDFAAWLPARLGLAMAFLESLSLDEFHALVDRRRPLIERNLQSFLAVSFRSLPPAAAGALVKHLIQMMRAKLDPIELIGKLVGRYHVPAEPPDHDPLGRLVAAGASPGMAVQTLLYGPLVAGFDADTLALFGPDAGFSNGLLVKLALFHLELERLTILMTYVNGKSRLRAELREKGAPADPVRFREAVETRIQAEHTADQAGRAQRGYHYLNMGRSHYKSARLCLDLLQADSTADPARTLDHLDRAWGYLELSLVAEQYPEFEAQERPQSLSQKGRAKVPFFFGEFGVRLMLCWLYNDLGRLAATGIRTSRPVEALAQELCAHWVKMHGKFREVEFGGFDDPKAAKLLIPRMMAMPAFCFHPQAADALRKLIAANLERLYGRYQADAAAFLKNAPP